MNWRERIGRFFVPEIYETLKVTNDLLYKTRETIEKSHDTIKILKNEIDGYATLVSNLNSKLEVCKKEDPVHPIEEFR